MILGSCFDIFVNMFVICAWLVVGWLVFAWLLGSWLLGCLVACLVVGRWLLGWVVGGCPVCYVVEAARSAAEDHTSLHTAFSSLASSSYSVGSSLCPFNACAFRSHANPGLQAKWGHLGLFFTPFSSQNPCRDPFWFQAR